MSVSKYHPRRSSLVWIFIVVGIIFSVASCVPHPSTSKAEEVVSDLRYVKDERTGICFAYTWVGNYRGGPALTAVPCEQIPPNLLVVAEVEEPQENR
jgi:uncharacterized membrane protein